MAYIHVTHKQGGGDDRQHNGSVDPSIIRIDSPVASQHHVDSDTKSAVLQMLNEKNKKHKKPFSAFTSVGKRIGHCIYILMRKSMGIVNMISKLGRKLYYAVRPKHKLTVKPGTQPFVKVNETANRTVQLASTPLCGVSEQPSLKTVEQPYIKVFNTQNGFPYFSPQTTVTYYFSSLWLHRALKYLSDIMVREKKESMFYATGIQDQKNNAYHVTDVLDVKMAHQSIISGREDIGSICKVVNKLAEHRLPLLVHCHSHPGAGPPSPSGVDVSTLRDFSEKQGAKDIIGLIFTTDGWVRFFTSPHRPFVVKVAGEGVTQRGPDVFKISLNHNTVQAKPTPPSRPRLLTFSDGKFTGHIKIADRYLPIILKRASTEWEILIQNPPQEIVSSCSTLFIPCRNGWYKIALPPLKGMFCVYQFG